MYQNRDPLYEAKCSSGAEHHNSPSASLKAKLYMMTSSIGTFSLLLAPCEGNPTVTGGFPSQRPVTRSFEVFLDLRLHKWLSKPSRRRWFETPSHSLWRHCNEPTKHFDKWWQRKWWWICCWAVITWITCTVPVFCVITASGNCTIAN